MPPNEKDDTEVVLRGVIRIENLPDATEFIPAVLERVKKEYVARQYNMPADWTDAEGIISSHSLSSASPVAVEIVWLHTPYRCTRSTFSFLGPSRGSMLQQNLLFTFSPPDFLTKLALQSGKLLRKGEPDLMAVSKIVLYDWQKGRLPFFRTPPLPTQVISLFDLYDLC